MAGKGGGAWKVAYADFVTAMMAFFMVMWITAQSDKVKEAVSQYFDNPYRGPSEAGTGTSPLPTARPGGSASPKRQAIRTGGNFRTTLETTGKQALEKDKQPGGIGNIRSNLYAVHAGDRSMVGTIVPFDEDSAELNAVGKARLDELIPALLGKPHKIEVRGHGSRRAVSAEGPYQDVWQLSYARCLATKKYLEQHGIEPERIRLSQAGDSEPYSIESDADLNKQNSRVEVYLLAELAEDLVGTRQERQQRFNVPDAKADEAELAPSAN